MDPRETENSAYAKFGVTNQEHYGMLWYFLEWSVVVVGHGGKLNKKGWWWCWRENSRYVMVCGGGKTIEMW